MTSKLLFRIFSDSESLYDYERKGVWAIKASDILRRIVAMERIDDGRKKTDTYYDGMGSVELKDYCTFTDLMGGLPRQIASEFLINMRGLLYVKEDKFEDWNLLKSKMSPLWIIAGFLSKTISVDDLNSQRLWLRFKNKSTKQFRYTAMLVPYIPDLDYFVKQTGGLNDLHIHLNGSTEADVIWNFMLTHPYIVVEDYNKEFYVNSKLRKHAEQVAFGFSPELLLNRLKDAINLRKKMIESLCEQYSGINFLGYGLEDELLLYTILIKHICVYKNERLSREFHYYMLIKGLIQSFVIMQQTQIGFSQFQLITDNTFRHRQEMYYKKRFLQLASGCNKHYIHLIEGRFSPQKTVVDSYKLVNRILKGFNKAYKEGKGLLDKDSLVLIAHFIKRPEKESEKEHFVRNYYLRKDIKNRALALIALMNNHPTIGEKIKGVDAAASEFDARPEVFAQTFTFLRESGIAHFTYHVGEDFCHLTSGFRAIYEAVEFLNLQSGDRLGHCTALGIPIELWMERNGSSCYISRGEWLDNLVFIWYLVKKGFIDFSQSVIFSLESRIAEISKNIYGDIYLPYELSEAWLLRRYIPDEELNSYYPKYSYDYFQNNKKVKQYNKDDKSKVGLLWRMYHEELRYTYHDGCNRVPKGCRSQYDELIRIKCDEILGVNELRQVQSFLLERLAEKNIVIEALPSSNMRISFYDHLQEYHLKRWLDDGNLETLFPSVVLGSDDPGIFMTNIYNEYALAYLHFKMNKLSPAKRIEKIKFIHEQSEIYCFKDGKL